MTAVRGFGSDNHSGAHPDVLAAITAANDGHADSYGGDPWTARVQNLFREQFGPDAEAFLVFNGTAANVLGIDAVTRPHEAVICPATAHLNVDECGAPERIAGVKLLTVVTRHGKLTPEAAAEHDVRRGDEHAVQPRVVSISQATEVGTVYTRQETATLAEWAHERELLLHVDGARLSNAAAALGVSLRDLTTDAGVDILSFGGTKNGLLVGDAVVFLRPGLAHGFAFIRKQGMQLASKMRFVAAQFEALFVDDLWRRNAEHANAMAQRLAERVTAREGVELAHPVEANGVFVHVPRPAIERLLADLPGEHPLYVWDEDADVIRLMCSWDTSDEDVERLDAALGTALAG